MAEWFDHEAAPGRPAPVVRPGMVEFPPRPGWPYGPHPHAGGPRTVRVSVTVVWLAALVLLILAYQVVGGVLETIQGLVD